MLTAAFSFVRSIRRLTWVVVACVCVLGGVAAAWGVRDTLPMRRMLAEAGHLESQLALARRFEAERPGPPDLPLAARYWKKAAALGHVGAMKRVGTLYYRGDGLPKNLGMALGWLRRAAFAGDREAQVLVAYFYHVGQGCPRDLPEARRWYERAASQGDVGAMLALGYLFQGGDGHPPDDGVAIRWYGLAADLGSAAAQFHLGVIHEEGQGVAAQPLEAYKWYVLAAERRHTLAAQGAAFLRSKLTPAQVAAARQRIAAWKKQHGESSDTRKGPPGDVPGSPVAYNHIS